MTLRAPYIGSSADFKVLTSQAFIDDFAGKIEQFSDIAINRIKTTHEEFTTSLVVKVFRVLS